MSKKLQVVAAAHLYRCVGYDDPRAVPVIISAPPPARHHNLFALVNGKAPDESGFLLSDGTFAGREMAMHIARAANQRFIDHPSFNGRTLYSEDLW